MRRLQLDPDTVRVHQLREVQKLRQLEEQIGDSIACLLDMVNFHDREYAEHLIRGLMHAATLRKGVEQAARRATEQMLSSGQLETLPPTYRRVLQLDATGCKIAGGSQ